MLLPGADLLLAERARELPQRDGLCGPYWARIVLAVLAGRTDLSQEDVALVAGTRTGGAPVLPPGERSRPPRRELPTGPAEQAGTSAAGLVAALAPLAVLPVPGEQLTAAALLALLEGLGALPGQVACLANVATAELTGRWSAGHVVALVGLQDRAVSVADSYASLGVEEHPVERVVEALRRPADPVAGGLLLVTGPDGLTDLVRVVREAGVRSGLWDNGTPFPAGTAVPGA